MCAGDLDLVALGTIEVADHVIAKAVDPVVVNVGVLAGHARPVDRAVGVDVLGDDLVRGVEQTFEAERVGAAATDKRVVGLGELRRLVAEDSASCRPVPPPFRRHPNG